MARPVIVEAAQDPVELAVELRLVELLVEPKRHLAELTRNVVLSPQRADEDSEVAVGKGRYPRVTVLEGEADHLQRDQWEPVLVGDIGLGREGS